MTNDDHTLHVRRLAWAGVEIRIGATRLLIDPLEHAAPLEPVMGVPKRPLPAVDTPSGTHVLITHLHPDHYDHELLAGLADDATVGCHAPIAPQVRAAGLNAIPQELGEPRSIGLLTVTPVTSLDWRGNDCDQVAWVVEGAGRRIIHCGDTQWHGSWWQIARDHGPFDVAFVPVNGVIARFEGYTADVPVTMTPEQAVEAAVALGATTVCAMHYGLFHNPPTYVEQDDIEQRFRRAAGQRGITAAIVADGQPVL
ncbi:MBL fold metallo-hydrolase [Micromonospora sp. WMMA1363]|uniref:MBL fold metallo-hydrolase n=1 Tax=Micromonospora sp. WMMA1363 TaxID=3053985 RepID=UPI00259CAE84|nr:MBL fold metallo-hydrolase [Micromonospora sp. WMMA1363]MDM4719535.1 MBL fold metallo-hydrolase [Micromonospora sp. WMMA1363]